MDSVMSKKREVGPSELLSKEFLSQFKTEADVSKFLKELHSQVLEQMLQGEMDSHLGYEKHSADGNNTGNSRNGLFPKKIQTEYGDSVIRIPRDRRSEFEPVVMIAIVLLAVHRLAMLTSAAMLSSAVRLPETFRVSAPIR